MLAHGLSNIRNSDVMFQCSNCTKMAGLWLPCTLLHRRVDTRQVRRSELISQTIENRMIYGVEVSELQKLRAVEKFNAGWLVSLHVHVYTRVHIVLTSCSANRSSRVTRSVLLHAMIDLRVVSNVQGREVRHDKEMWANIHRATRLKSYD